MTAHSEDAHAQHADTEVPGGEGGHAVHWGDYNSRPAEPSTLPAISPWALVIFGVTLGMLLAAMVIASFDLSLARHI